MRIGFMGSPRFALPTLNGLLKQHDVVVVLSKPDIRAGRGQIVAASPVKQMAQDAGITVLTPECIKNDEFIKSLEVFDLDLMIVVAYGKILPVSLLTLPKYGCLNVHASLLPAYRGAAPIQWALINGETQTGVTIMQLDEGLDTGDIMITRSIDIQETDTSDSLHETLSVLGCDALLDALTAIEQGKNLRQLQPPEGVSYAPMLKKKDGHILWNDTAKNISCRIQGVTSWPGAYIVWNGKNIKMFGSKVSDHFTKHSKLGTILSIHVDGVEIACSIGSCMIMEFQAAGKKRMSAKDFCVGRALRVGMVLGDDNVKI